MRHLLIATAMTIFLASCGSETETKSEQKKEALLPRDHSAVKMQLDSLAKQMKGKFSLAFRNIETGDTFSYNGTEHKPMMSTVKFPLALVIMQQVDAGTIKMDQKERITEADMKGMHRSPLWDDMGKKAGEVSVHDMLVYMIAESDNVTCNKFTQMAGGVDALKEKINALGMKGIGLLGRENDKSAIDFSKPYENWCEPTDMAMLVAKFYKGEILGKVSTDTLRSIMERAKRSRISGKLPAGTVVAHKTGTGGMENRVTVAVNDIGIVTLPNGQHLVLTVFVTEVAGDMEAGEAMIADIARIAYDEAVK